MTNQIEDIIGYEDCVFQINHHELFLVLLAMMRYRLAFKNMFTCCQTGSALDSKHRGRSNTSASSGVAASTSRGGSNYDYHV